MRKCLFDSNRHKSSKMLIYMWNDMMAQIKMRSEGTHKYKESVRDIGKIASTLGDIQKHLTFIYTF